MQGHSDFVGCLTCSTAESKIQITPPCHGNLSRADQPDDDCDHSSTAATSADEETELLIPGSSSKPKRSAVLYIIRNILGILLIAGVSFGLGVGAQAGGFLGATWDRRTDGSASEWSEIQQAGTKTSVGLEVQEAQVSRESSN